LIYVIDTVQVFLPKCPLTTIRSRFSANCPRRSWGYIYCSSTLNRLLTVVRGHFGRKNEYRYLTYTTIIGNSFDRKKPNQQPLTEIEDCF